MVGARTLGLGRVHLPLLGVRVGVERDLVVEEDEPLPAGCAVATLRSHSVTSPLWGFGRCPGNHWDYRCPVQEWGAQEFSRTSDRAGDLPHIRDKFRPWLAEAP